MALNVAGFVLGQAMARSRNVTDPAAVNQISVLGAVVGLSPLGLVVTSVAAQNAVPVQRAVAAAPAAGVVAGGANPAAAAGVQGAGTGGAAAAGAQATVALTPIANVTATPYDEVDGHVLVRVSWPDHPHASYYVVAHTHKTDPLHYVGQTRSPPFVDALPSNARPDHYTWSVYGVRMGAEVDAQLQAEFRERAATALAAND